MKASTLEYCPYGFFFVLTHLFCEFSRFIEGYHYDWHFREMVFQTFFFFSVFGRGCIMQSCSYQPFLLVFRISRTGPVLSPKIWVSLARKQTPPSKKGSTNKTPGAASLTLQFNSAIRGMKPFFFLATGTGRTRKVRLNGHRTEPVNPTRWGPKDLHFCSQVRLLKCLKLKEERQIKHGP